MRTWPLDLPIYRKNPLFVDEIAWSPEPDVTLDFSDFEGLLKGTTSQGAVAATVIQTREDILFVTMPVSFSK